MVLRRFRVFLLLIGLCMAVTVAVGRPSVWAVFLVPLLVGTLGFFEFGAVVAGGAAGLSLFARVLIDGSLTSPVLWDGLIALALFTGCGLLLGRALRRQRRREDQLAAGALHDRLTGLYNYGTFADLLHREVSRADRYGGRVTLIMLDLDRFKRFNDRYGHEAGNLLLRSLGELLRGLVRDADIAARYGGEELAVVIRGDELDGVLLAERIRAAVLTMRIPVDGEEAYVSVSAGVACYPDGAADEAELVEQADAALYVSKQAGRNLVTGHSLGLSRDGRRRGAAGERRLRAVASG